MPGLDVSTQVQALLKPAETALAEAYFNQVRQGGTCVHTSPHIDAG